MERFRAICKQRPIYLISWMVDGSEFKPSLKIIGIFSEGFLDFFSSHFYCALVTAIAGAVISCSAILVANLAAS